MSGAITVRRARILVNPVARSVRRRFDPEGAMRFLRARGIEATLVFPSSTAEAAREAADEGVDTLFVVGGDGTLRQASIGLAGTKTALAAIPAGTTNVWAREAGIPHGIRTAFESHVEGQRVRMDLGRANGVPFLLMVSAGWDADVVRSVNPAFKKRTGKTAYAISAARAFPFFRPVRAEMRSGIAHWDVHLAVAIISNTRLYGGLVEPSPGAVANDGLLDVCALCPERIVDSVRLTGRLFAHRMSSDIRAVTLRVPEFTIETAGIPYQLDGDFAGYSPLDITVDPGALLVSVPSGPLPRIFTSPA